MFDKLRNRRREKKALVKIVAGMQADERLIIEDLARQVEEKLAAMTPEEQAKAIRILKQS